jgi:acetolactate synthase-1/2/3 large subunit
MIAETSLMKNNKITVAEMIARKLKSRGVQRIFGVPGGGSSLDLIDATAKHGIEFHLSKREDSAVMMAAVTAEISGAPGVVLTTKGPGTANAVNGVAYASLDRSPVVVFTDGFSPAIQQYVTHQVFDQKALLEPVTKAHGLLEVDDPSFEFEQLLNQASCPPFGPVHVELTSSVAGKEFTIPEDHELPKNNEMPNQSAVDEAGILLASANQPVIIVGLEARTPAIAKQIEALANKLNCPCLVTYKAKGVIADGHPNFVGIFTGGKAEQPCVSQADLIILIGMDPVELILQPWPYKVPVLDVAEVKHTPHYTTPNTGLYGPLGKSLDAIEGYAQQSRWIAGDIAMLKSDMKARLAFPLGNDLNPQSIVELAQVAAVHNPRVTVDAGAHMISATTFWKAYQPNDLLISNGLATMGFAVPAAVAAALADPVRGAIAFTGDGGFMMCASELALAAQTNANIVVVVFNDGTLSQIDIKQKSRNLSSQGVTWPRPDFAKVAEGLGCHSWRVDVVEDYKVALKKAFETKGPSLIDVVVDPQGYGEQLTSLRG